jgi:ArsR family transcriptional regulator
MSSLGATSDLLGLLAEPSRVRLLALLGNNELTVNELCSVTELGQSRVSTHLGRLREAGLLRDRRAGGSPFYRRANGEMPDAARKLWSVVASELDDAQLASDRRRCAGVLRARAAIGRWPDSVAGEMERHYSPGRTWDALARGLVGLLRLGDVLDAGSGDGAIAQLVAPRARTYTLLDRSERMLGAARTRLAKQRNARFLHGDLHAVPAPAAAFDQVLLLNVLPYAERPAAVLGEVARVLRPGGAVALVTVDEHTHAELAAQYGHVQPGFRPATLRRLLVRAGLVVERCEVTSRERREPHLNVVTALAHKAESQGGSHVD